MKDTHDLLDNLRGRVEVDEALVHLELELVPGLGTLTARGLAGGDAEDLGGEADGTLYAEVTIATTGDEIAGD